MTIFIYWYFGRRHRDRYAPPTRTKGLPVTTLIRQASSGDGSPTSARGRTHRFRGADNDVANNPVIASECAATRELPFVVATAAVLHQREQ